MAHTLDDLWTKLDGMDKRVIIIETKMTEADEKKRRKRETISYVFGCAIGSLALLNEFWFNLV